MIQFILKRLGQAVVVVFLVTGRRSPSGTR